MRKDKCSTKAAEQFRAACGACGSKPPREAPALPLPCLCVFGPHARSQVTAMQGSTTATCPGIEASPGVVDSAFEGGELSLSWLAVRLGRSVCKACSLGVISAGPVGWALRFCGKPAAACRLRSFC